MSTWFSCNSCRALFQLDEHVHACPNCGEVDNFSPTPAPEFDTIGYVTMCVGGGAYSGKPGKKTPRLIAAIKNFVRTLTDKDYDD